MSHFQASHAHRSEAFIVTQVLGCDTQLGTGPTCAAFSFHWMMTLVGCVTLFPPLVTLVGLVVQWQFKR
eukprot:789023-Amphidinium_carterae.1